MIERDYILRILQQFFELLERLIHNKAKQGTGQTQTTLDTLYGSFLGRPAEFYKENSLDEIIQSFGETDHLPKIEMLSELLYQDALLKEEGEARRTILGKSLSLFEYLDAHSTTYSVSRQQKINEVRREMAGHPMLGED